MVCKNCVWVETRTFYLQSGFNLLILLYLSFKMFPDCVGCWKQNVVKKQTKEYMESLGQLLMNTAIYQTPFFSRKSSRRDEY